MEVMYMTDYKEILRVLSQGMSQRGTALACQVARNTVSGIVRRCKIHGITWNDAQGMSNAEIHDRLFPEDQSQRDTGFFLPDYAEVHKELGKPHVTLQLLWEEYCRLCEKSGLRYYQYTQFCK